MPTSALEIEAYREALLPRKGRATVVDQLLDQFASELHRGFPEMVMIVDEQPALRKSQPLEEYQIFLGYHPQAYEDFIKLGELYQRAGHNGNHRLSVRKTPNSLELILEIAKKHCNAVISLQRGLLWQRDEIQPPFTDEPHLGKPEVITFREIEAYFGPEQKVSVMFAENGKNRQRLLSLARKEGFSAIRTTIPFLLAIVYRGRSFRISMEGLGAFERSFTDFASIKEMRAHSLHPHVIWEFI